MCNMALAIVKQLQFDIESDFPGNGSFDAILNAITRGDPDKAQGMFHLAVCAVNAKGAMETKKQVDIDVKEGFMAYVYWDLVAFIQDFQKNRTGNPTKAMLPKLSAWDPNLNLKTASRTKRNEWRTAYTINWLYDFVVLWSSVVMQRKNGSTTGKPQHFVLENEDWSVHSKWAEHRVLWGPLEFAADITAWAMSKPPTDVKSKILPHHVFQMQCIVDSFTISRGWTFSLFEGNVFSTPPKYDPRKDIKLFQDRDGSGINQSMDVFLSLIMHNPAKQRISEDHCLQAEMMGLLKEDMNHWLGSSKLAYGLKTLPLSRFSNTNTNGLWEYSPYLCGTGLADALEYVYNLGMAFWETHPEATSILHLYNMLEKTGYIKQKIETFEQCIDLFGETVFAGGQRPTDNFFKAFKNSVGVMDVRGVLTERRKPKRTAIGSTPTNPKDFWSSAPKKIFKRRSLLGLLKGTNWRPEKIHDADLPKHSMLNGMRLAAKDKKFKQQKRQRSSLASAHRSPGKERGPGAYNNRSQSANDPFPSLLNLQDTLQPGKSSDMQPDISRGLKTALGIPDDYTVEIGKPEHVHANTTPLASRLSNHQYLQLLERDVVGDICGNICPLSGINYLNLLCVFKVVFVAVEQDGRHIKMIREASSGGQKQQRAALAAWAFQDRDPELLTLFAKQMVACMGKSGLGSFCYFPNLVAVWDVGYEGTTKKDTMEGQCSMM